MRRRVESQAYFAAPSTIAVPTVLDEALAKYAEVVREGANLTQNAMGSLLDNARACMDRAEYARHAAAGTAAQAVADMDKLRARIACDARRADDCREEIRRLEAEVMAERVAKLRRQEYDALATVALRFPSRTRSNGELAAVGAKCRRLEGEERRLQAAQECVKKNFMLVMQSSGDLQAYAASDAFAGGDDDDSGFNEGDEEALPPADREGSFGERGSKRLRTSDIPPAAAENGAAEEVMKDVRFV